MTSIVEVIQHYQRSIDSSQDNEARLLHCINKLYKLPIKVEHLQETGVGKTVNSLRKFNGEIGVAAKTLVTKWKAMVAAEEEPMDTSSQNNENETPKNDDNDDAGSTPHDEEDDENLNRNNTSQQLEKSKHRNGDKKDISKDRHKERSSSRSGHKDSKSSSSSSHHHGSEKSSKHTSDKHKTTSSSSSKDKEMHHKSSSDHSSSSSNHKDKGGEKEKTDHKSRNENHIDKDDKHDKDKKREEKSKKDKEHKTDANSATHSSQHKSKSHSSSSSSSKSKHDDSHSHSVSKEKERSEKQKSSSKDKEQPKDEKSSSSHSSSKDNPEHKSSTHSSTSKSSTKDSESLERKRRHNSDDDSTDFKSPQPKVAKTQKPTKLESSPAQEEEEADDCFDSSMGANFDDVLGMLNMPKKKSKKSLKSPTTPSNGGSSSSKKESTPHKPTNSNSSSGSGDVSKLNGGRSTIPASLYSIPSTSKASTMKPDLLAPTAKLEPLDPSIVLELPTISTNYKPMPLNQTVMDCVFNNTSNSKPPVRTLSDAEAMSHGISSKTMRTKIYSGVRTGQTYQVSTLFDMCIRILQKNIDALEYTGGVPFEVLKPVLERATPQQLYVFEEYNPYLMEDSDVLWQQHVSRNFRTKKRLENESWREMFIRCQEEEERRLSVLKDSIKASQKIAAAPVRKTQLAFVDSMVKPPRNVLKKQEQYGTKSKLVATPAARVASLSSVTPNAAKTGDQRLRVAATVRDHAQVSSSAIRTKKAPLMQKTLQFIRGRHKR